MTTGFITDRHTLPSSVLGLAHSLRDPSTLTLKEGDEVGLANGLAGMVLLPLTLAFLFPEQGWLDVAESYFTRIAYLTRLKPLTLPGLYHGSCGVACSLSLLAQQDVRYQPASLALLGRLVTQVTSWNWRASPFLPGQENFEGIGGAAGILCFLLSRSDEAKIQPALAHLISYLIWVSEQQERWIHRPERLSRIAQTSYPQGYIDLGLAHGLAGPLAALSLAVLHSYHLPGMKDAIERWSAWISDQQVNMPWGRDWPGVVPLPLQEKECPPARAAWCYGTPGIARALWLAGQALADASLCALAREALAATFRRPSPERNIDEPQICHGLAGLLLICLRFQHDDAQGMPWLQDAIAMLSTELHRRWEATYAQMPLSFLTGSIGGALALIAVQTNHVPLWDHVLLIS